MLHKILLTILSFFGIINIVSILFGYDIVQDMYSAYGLTNQLPNAFLILFNFRFLLWGVLIFIICFILWYNIYFNKTRRTEKPELYKKVSIISYIVCGVLLITTLFLFIFCILKPTMGIYMGSFLFEANGI